MTTPLLDRAAQRFLNALNRTAHGEVPPTISTLRAASVELAKLSCPPPPVERTNAWLDVGGRGVRTRLYSPLGRANEILPGLVYFHGGGLVAGDLDTHDALTATLAAGADCRVLAVDYARAPENKFPAARNDAIAVTLAALDRPQQFAFDPARVAVGGDSAGGQLAALAALAARDAGAPLALQLLLCPVMDSLGRTSSRAAMSSGRLLDEATMRAYWEAYRIEGLDDRDPRVAPLAASDFSDLAPGLVHVAEGDPLYDEGLEYGHALARAGVPCRVTRHAGLIHHFYGLDAVIPAARPALAAIVEDLRAAFWPASQP